MITFYETKKENMVLHSKFILIKDLLVKINLVLFHFNERERTIHPGNEDEDTVYYMIRPRGQTEGLLSSYFYVVEETNYAISKGYVPVVDFRFDNCQFLLMSI